jgi:hypothetical protein
MIDFFCGGAENDSAKVTWISVRLEVSPTIEYNYILWDSQHVHTNDSYICSSIDRIVFYSFSTMLNEDRINHVTPSRVSGIYLFIQVYCPYATV